MNGDHRRSSMELRPRPSPRPPRRGAPLGSVLLLSLVIGGAAAGGGCATEEEKQVAARVAALQESARSWFAGNDGKLCPLAEAEAWVAPFSSISLEPSGSSDQHKAIMPFW